MRVWSFFSQKAPRITAFCEKKDHTLITKKIG